MQKADPIFSPRYMPEKVKVICLVGAAVAGSICLWLARPEHVTPLNAVLALATMWISCTPLAAFFLRRDTSPPMPFIGLTGLYYGVFYGLSVFFFEAAKPQEIEPHGLRIVEINVEAQLLVLGGVVLMMAAYHLLRPRLAGQLPHLTFPRQFSIARLRLLLWILLIVYLVWRWVPQIHALPSIGQFIQSVGPLAIGMFLVLWHRKELSRIEAALIVFGAIPLILVQDFASSLLTAPVLFCAFLMVILLYLRVRYFWLLGVLPVLCVVVLYPGVSMLRGELWKAPEQQRTVGDKALSLMRHAGEAWNRNSEFRARTIRPLRDRFAGFILLSHVVNLTPSEVPYWAGETYKPLPTSFIPRVLWPDKPQENNGHVFGHRYRILHPEDPNTSINIPWIVEMYANFGRYGVLFGMLLAGGFLALVSAIFNRREMTPLEFVIGAAIIFPLVYPASNFSLMTGSLLPLAISLWIYFRVGLSAGQREGQTGQ